MSKFGPAATAEIPDDLGNSTHRKLALKFVRPRDFRASEVIKQVEFLATLSSIAEDLNRKGSLQSALAKLKSTVGHGPLVQAAQQLVDTPPKIETAAKTDATPEPAPTAAEPTAAKAGNRGGSAIDAIFAQADIAPVPTAAEPSSAAKSGLDAFIGAMRSSGTGSERSSTSAATKSRAQELAELLQRAVEAAVLDLMATPVIASLEITWRGFRTIVSASPGADSLAIDMLDTDDAALVEHLTRCLDVPPMDRPDAVFVPFAVGSTETLAALASLGERHCTPIITEVHDEVTGAKLDAEADPAPDSWTELRSMTATRWLCACKNAMVLANEEVGITRRIVLGSPVWGVAAMLSASVGQTGGPAQIFGRAGALVGPASHGLESDHQSIATEHVATIDHQHMLADRGVLVLGSERGSDRLRLAAAPMVHAREDDPQLPGQILVGRTARFTRAVRDDLPPHATEQEIATRLTEAATNFLPRSPRGAIALNVQTDAQGKLEVEASIGAALAGSSFKFSSDL